MKRTIDRMRAEFLEMPGLHLTAAQIERLLGVDPALCQPVLNALVDLRFLRVHADGTYSRCDEGGDTAHRMGRPVAATSRRF